MAVVLLAGGTAAIVSSVVVGGRSQPAATAFASPQALARADGTRADGAQAAGMRAARGEITAMDGSTWTIRTVAGQLQSVAIGDATTFGTNARPQALGSFHVGTRVAVYGRRADASWSATRVVALGSRKAGAAVPSPSPTM